MNQSLESRIVIVGAGPAGLSTAMFLKERGYTNVTVLEKEQTVGGKCLSFEYDGIRYDLGANLTTPRYTSIRPLAEKLGLTRRKIADRRIVNVGEEQFESLTDASLLERLVVRTGASYYAQARHLTGIERDGYANLREGVEAPFRTWLKRHGLGKFEELFGVLFVAYGYGEMMDQPAAYALKFFDKVHLDASIDTVMGKDVPFTTDFVEGFQELWERVDSHLEINTRRGCNISRISRSPRGVEVAYEVSGQSVVEQFDKLILACPLQDTVSFMDVSAEEERLFSQIQTNDYFVTVAKLRNVDDVSTYVYPYARKFSPGFPTVFYPPVEGDDSLFIFYAYGGEGITEEVVRERIRETVAEEEFNGDLEEFLTTQHWRYFPHVSSEAMQAGFYDDLEALQGTFHTYYTGEVLSFTLVELIHRYSKRLVQRFF